MTWSDWLLFVGAVAVFTLLGFMGKNRGTLFSDEAPKWASKFVMGLIAGYFISQLARIKRFGLRETMPTKPVLPGGTPVLVEMGNRLSPAKVDFGSAAIEDGRLLFSGEHASFQVNLAEIEVMKINNANHTVMAWIPRTKQRLQITSNAVDDVLTWPSFVRDLVGESGNTGQESTHPPKTSSWSWIMPLLVILGAILLTEGIIVGAWSVAKSISSPLYPTFIVLDALLLSLAVLLYLQIDLRLWRRRRLLQKQKDGSV